MSVVFESTVTDGGHSIRNGVTGGCLTLRIFDEKSTILTHQHSVLVLVRCIFRCHSNISKTGTAIEGIANEIIHTGRDVDCS